MLVLHDRRLGDDERIEDAVEEVEQGLVVMIIGLWSIKFNCLDLSIVPSNDLHVKSKMANTMSIKVRESG